MRRGQSTLEYAFLIGIVAAAIIAMNVYMKRGFQGNLRSLADQVGAGSYSPGNTIANNSETHHMQSQVVSTTTTNTTYGTGQPDTPEIRAKRDEVKGLSDQLKDLSRQRRDAILRGDMDTAQALSTQIVALQKVFKQAQKELKDLIDAYRDRSVIPDIITTDTTSIDNGTEDVDKQTNETLGSFSADTWN